MEGCSEHTYHQLPPAAGAAHTKTARDAAHPAPGATALTDRVGTIIGLVLVLSVLAVALTGLVALVLWLIVSLGVPAQLIASAVSLVLAVTLLAVFITTRPRRKP